MTDDGGRHVAQRAAGATLGGVLAVATNALGALPRVKPLHPRGEVHRATVEVDQPWPELGVPVLATTAALPALARLSRATGLAEPVPDVSGFALRVVGHGDLLFASTGTGRVGRRLLTLRRDRRVGPMTTLVPLRCAAGSLDLRVDHRHADEAVLAGSVDGSPWREIATIRYGRRLDADDQDDGWLRMDPVGNLPTGLSWSPFWVAARDPAYRLARSLSRGSS